MIQVNKTGEIITINAPQSSPSLTTLSVALPPEVASNPEHYRWDGSEFVLTTEVSNAQQYYNAKRYLEATDFYVTRKLETELDIPTEIQQKRQKARDILTVALPEFSI
ncbi:hypothetical protein QF117_09145 [Vibrio sp. YMD68]|uniref:hypothetical protein n=1 Tax=Vibrio sp. YMD68 TaxID=3042300 RepID=UPI00249B59F1|nr:hypothetical protein [Vibrio sp. YMD68]WGW00352.1 hypothetical protein QF117_21230 [Vibrio sp. YMD68]WGW00967.1 hypothetical protein QF117_09145 [Vibrio sp. YMD68]